jgi:hypothetical protein
MNESNAIGTPRFEPGKFVTLTKSQLRAKMRPGFELKSRVWACLMLHIGGNNGEVAQVIKKGSMVPMRLPDIAKELREVEKEYYWDAGIEPPPPTTDWNLRRAFRELEQAGIAERQIDGRPVQPQDSMQSREIRILVWYEPRKTQKQVVKQNRIKAEPVPLQEGLFQKAMLRKIKSVLGADDPQIVAFLKKAESDPAAAEVVAHALANASQAFRDELAVTPEKSDATATKTGKIVALTSEKSDATATKNESLYRKLNYSLNKQERGTSSSAVLEQAKDDDAVPSLPDQNQDQFPLTLAAIRKRDPACSPAFASRVVETTIQTCIDSSAFPQSQLRLLTDKTISVLVRESFRTGPKNHGTGLLLHRVPQIAIAKAQEE